MRQIPFVTIATVLSVYIYNFYTFTLFADTLKGHQSMFNVQHEIYF